MNKIKLGKVEQVNGVGKIEISVETDGNFVCGLNVEKGTGLVKVGEKKGRGKSLIVFEGVDINSIHLVEVEFLDQGNNRCRKLQLSGITIE